MRDVIMLGVRESIVVKIIFMVQHSERLAHTKFEMFHNEDEWKSQKHMLMLIDFMAHVLFAHKNERRATKKKSRQNATHNFIDSLQAISMTRHDDTHNDRPSKWQQSEKLFDSVCCN